MLLHPLNVAMSLRFLAIGFALIWVMKISSLMVARESFFKFLKFYFLTPLPSLETWRRSKHPDRHAIRTTLVRALKFLIISVIYFYIYWAIRDRYEIPWLGIMYLSSPLLWLYGEWATSLLQLLSLSSGKLIPPHHLAPPLSVNLSEFWGKRWNTWFYDWFHQVLFKKYRRSPLQALLLTFLISGLGHEVVISLPFYSITGINVFGTMTAFFVLQGIGIIIDSRAFNKTQKRARLVFMWFWLLLLAPLFMNEGTLRLLHTIR